MANHLPKGNFLFVPVSLDALFLRQDQMAAEGFADFSKLPYTDTNQDFNPDTANISENILSQPLNNLNLQLKAGVHLHWQLPGALAKQTDTTNNSIAANGYPKTPNRWLIVKDGTPQYMVESNFLHPATNDGTLGYVTIPSAAVMNEATSYPQRFRYLGRQLTYAEWQQESNANEYWGNLTAAGYGEPTFASFYPNCHSVFGAFDSVIPKKTITYEVYGWYAETADDPLSQLILHLDSAEVNTIQEAVSAEFGWAFDENIIPQQLICYGQAQVSPDNQPEQTAEISLFISDNPSSALIACLAGKTQEEAVVSEQLEAILLNEQFDYTSPDFWAKIQEARKLKGFAKITGGIRWILKHNNQATENQAPQQLPERVLELLQDLNQQEASLDQLKQEMGDRQQQLFADWYKYMICNYPPLGEENDFPDPNRVKFFLKQEAQDLSEIINSQYAAAIDQRDGAVEALATEWLKYNPDQDLPLKDVPAPRYYQPNEPSLLIIGLDSRPELTNNGALTCQAVDLDLAELIAGTVDLPANLIRQYAESGINTSGGFPLFFEWQATFSAAADGSNLSTKDRNYSESYIGSNFQQATRLLDWQAKSPENVEQGQNIYTGRSYLDRKAGKGLLLEKLTAYLETWVVPSYQKAKNISTEASEILQDHFDDFKTWVESTYASGFSEMPYSATSAYANLQDLSPVSQVLSGYNDTLLMRKLTLQLAIEDPIGFADNQQFATEIAEAVSGNIRHAPQPLVDFNPIRGGQLAITQLNIIDNFGLGHQASLKDQTTSLPPRFTQACRLATQWLDGSDSLTELTDTPASSPICGWLLPNNLDQSLMVYDHVGQGLGAVTMNESQRWQPNPGDANPISVAQIQNPPLQEIVQYILSQDTSFLSAFLATLNSGLENIQPTNFKQHVAKALLMGSPIAVTRLQVSLEVKGDLATDQSWDAFRHTLQNGIRNTHGFEQVQIPTVIGSFDQLDDGVLGFWEGSIMDQENVVFNAVASTDKDTPSNIQPHSAAGNPVTLTLSQAPILLTVLMDPRGKLHASCPVLPTTALEIPPYMYAHALESIQIGFLTAPILTGENIALPVPNESGYSWSFNQLLNDGSWHQWARQGIVTLSQVTGKFQNGAELWSEMITYQWIATADNSSDETARIVPKDQRKEPQDGAALLAVSTAMESFLDDLILGIADAKARFVPEIRIREGWLKLTPNQDMTQGQETNE